jgi:hypothetical protein
MWCVRCTGVLVPSSACAKTDDDGEAGAAELGCSAAAAAVSATLHQPGAQIPRRSSCARCGVHVHPPVLLAQEAEVLPHRRDGGARDLHARVGGARCDDGHQERLRHGVAHGYPARPAAVRTRPGPLVHHLLRWAVTAIPHCTRLRQLGEGGVKQGDPWRPSCSRWPSTRPSSESTMTCGACTAASPQPVRGLSPTTRCVMGNTARCTQDHYQGPDGPGAMRTQVRIAP